MLCNSYRDGNANDMGQGITTNRAGCPYCWDATDNGGTGTEKTSELTERQSKPLQKPLTKSVITKEQPTRVPKAIIATILVRPSEAELISLISSATGLQ